MFPRASLCEAPPDTAPLPEPGAGTMVKDLGSALELAVGYADELGPAYSLYVAKLQELQQRLVQQRFHLAVLGQFKRGKSTLLNALIGLPILPTAVVPLTAIPTFLHWGADLSARVGYENGRPDAELVGGSVEELASFLARFVTEEGNPHNRLGVSQVNVSCPSPLLRDGLVLIDTPGIGSTLQHNTQATLAFLPQCDAALFLVSADPPLTQVEIEFLKEVRDKVPRLFFILNKVDYLSPREQEQALAFLRRVLHEQGGIAEDVPVFCLSARRGLEARLQGDEGLWASSGMQELEDYLVRFLAQEKASALRLALARKAAAVLASLQGQLQLARRSLELPLDELERRGAALERAVEEARGQLLIAGDLLRGDRARTITFLEEQAEGLRQEATAYFEAIVEQQLGQDENARAPQAAVEAAREALAAAIPGFFEQRLGALSQALDEHVRRVLAPHEQRANALIESVRASAAELFDIPYQAPESAEAFEAKREPYWVTHKWDAHVSPLPPGLVDRLLPLATQRQRAKQRLESQVQALVRHNVENLRWAELQNVNQAFQRFSNDLEQRLEETIAATQGAVATVHQRRLEQSASLTEELASLEQADARIERLRQDLAAFAPD